MAHYNDITALRRAFVRKGNPFYIVKGKKGDIITANEVENEIEAAGDMLADDLRDMAESGELSIYSFKVMPKDINKASGGLLTTYQRKNIYSTDEKVEYYRNQARGTDPALLQMLQEMREESKLIRDELAEQRRLALEMSQADDDDEVEEQAENNTIGAILGNPAVQQILTALITNIGANMVTSKPQARPVAMAGTDDDAEIMELVQRLFANGVTIEHLRKLSEMPKLKIQSLLFML